MSQTWDQAKIEQFIENGIEENLNLDYKAADALDKSKKREITKDVSAMANSSGGLIVYGIKEYDDSERKHLPEAIDPIDRTLFSKEWLEHVISNIQPRIGNIIIHPVSIDSPTNPNEVVYVVEIPQGTTAYQAMDKKYYRRYNFESVAMLDYEINDIRGRANKIEQLVNFYIVFQHTSMVLLAVENFGTIPAFDVKFKFSPELKWHNNEVPPFFARGVKMLLPQRKYFFPYASYLEILGEASSPTSFEVVITYRHPQINDYISDTFYIDFLDYKYSMPITSDLQQQTEVLNKAIQQLSNALKELKKKPYPP